MSDPTHEYESDPAGDYGPTVKLTPIYASADQRQQIRPLLWNGKNPHPAFAQAVCVAAKRGLAAGLEKTLGKAVVEAEQLSYSARLDALPAEPDFEEEFHLEVESSQPEEVEFSEEWTLRHSAATGDEKTIEILMESIRKGVAEYLASAGFAEDFAWRMEIDGWGGG